MRDRGVEWTIQELLQVARKSEFRNFAGFDVRLLVLASLSDSPAAPPHDFSKGLENLGILAIPGSRSEPAKGGGRQGGSAVHDRMSSLH